MDAVRPEGVQVFLNARQRLLTTGAPATLLLFIVPSSTCGELSASGQRWVEAFPQCQVYHWTTPGSTAARPGVLGVVNHTILSDADAVGKLWRPLLERAAARTPDDDPSGLRYLIG
jgi:hypothetical protein